jgi:hypothetical protein
MSGGRDALSGEQRGDNVGFSDVSSEFFNGTGPETSFFEGDHKMNKGLLNGGVTGVDSNIDLTSEFENFQKSGALKDGPTNMNFGVLGALEAGSNMERQMVGSYNVSFYKLGDRTLSFASDSKSRWSLYLHIPSVQNFSRAEGVPMRNFGMGQETGRTQRKTTTFQKYLFFMN